MDLEKFIETDKILLKTIWYLQVEYCDKKITW